MKWICSGLRGLRIRYDRRIRLIDAGFCAGKRTAEAASPDARNKYGNYCGLMQIDFARPDARNNYGNNCREVHGCRQMV